MAQCFWEASYWQPPPIFAHGGTLSIREFVVGALQAEMGLQAGDPELALAHNGGKFVTPSGMVLDGSMDLIEAPPAVNSLEDPDGDGIRNEIPTSLVDYLEFYLSNYFKPATTRKPMPAEQAHAFWRQLGVPHVMFATCHLMGTAASPT